MNRLIVSQQNSVAKREFRALQENLKKSGLGTQINEYYQANPLLLEQIARERMNLFGFTLQEWLSQLNNFYTNKQFEFINLIFASLVCYYNNTKFRDILKRYETTLQLTTNILNATSEKKEDVEDVNQADASIKKAHDLCTGKHEELKPGDLPSEYTVNREYLQQRFEYYVEKMRLNRRFTKYKFSKLEPYFFYSVIEYEQMKKKEMAVYKLIPSVYEEQVVKSSTSSEFIERTSYVHEYHVDVFYRNKELVAIIFYQYVDFHLVFGKHTYIDIWCSRPLAGGEGAGIARYSLFHTFFKAYQEEYSKIILDVTRLQNDVALKTMSVYLNYDFVKLGEKTESDTMQLKTDEEKKAKQLVNAKKNKYNIMILNLTPEMMLKRKARLCLELDVKDLG